MPSPVLSPAPSSQASPLPSPQSGGHLLSPGLSWTARGSPSRLGQAALPESWALEKLQEQTFPALAKAAAGRASPEALEAIAALADQAVRCGIDYQSLGQGWSHPTTRLQYRRGDAPSATCPQSRRRAEESRQRLVALLEAVASGSAAAEDAVVSAFLREVGLQDDNVLAAGAGFAAVAAALKAELLRTDNNHI